MAAIAHQGAVRNWRNIVTLQLGGTGSVFADDPTSSSLTMDFAGALCGGGISLEIPLVAQSVTSECQGVTTADLAGSNKPGKLSFTVERRYLIGPVGQPSAMSILRQSDDGTLIVPLRVTRGNVRLASRRRGFRLMWIGDAVDDGDAHSERVTVDFVLDDIPAYALDGKAPELTIGGVVHVNGDVLIERVGA